MSWRRSRWPFVAGIGLVAGALVTYMLVPSHAPAPAPPATDPWSAARPPPTAAELERDDKNRAQHDKDMQTFNGMISLFGSTIDRMAPQHGPPQTAADWLVHARAQTPADSIASIESALTLEPTSLEAQAMLCNALAAAARDPREIETACDVALSQRPDDVALLSSRAHGRTRAGDHDGAKTDLDHACRLGDSIACKLDP